MEGTQDTAVFLLLIGLALLGYWFKEAQNYILGAAIGTMLFLLLIFGILGAIF